LAGSVPRWCVDALKLLVFILYFYAGLAKLNSDWFLQALPLKIWLPARNDMPLIGRLFNQEWVPYVFSWFGCIYDLTIVFLLLNQKTRVFAYLTVVAFHLMTALLFPIGMFSLHHDRDGPDLFLAGVPCEGHSKNWGVVENPF
jgi:hypothetical protein